MGVAEILAVLRVVIEVLRSKEFAEIVEELKRLFRNVFDSLKE